MLFIFFFLFFMPIEKSPFDFFGYMLRGGTQQQHTKKKYRRRKNERVPLFSHVPSDRVVVFFSFWTLEISYKVIFFFFLTFPPSLVVLRVLYTHFIVCAVLFANVDDYLISKIPLTFSILMGYKNRNRFNSFIFYYIINKKRWEIL